MGVCNTAPLFRRLVNTGLDFVIGRRFSALNHCPNIEFVFQDAEHRHSGPFRHFVELEAGFEVQPNGFLILHGRQYALAVELVRDSLGAHTIQLPAENLSNSFGGSFVNDELVFILRVLTVAIGSKGTDKIAISALYSLAAADLDGDILGIGVVHQIFEGQHHIVCGGAFRHAVVIVIDSNEADPHKGKNFFQVFTGFDIVPSEPGEVLDYHTICCAGSHIVHDCMKARTVKGHTGNTVIFADLVQPELRPPMDKIGQHSDLVANGFALFLVAVLAGCAHIDIYIPDLSM